MLGPSPTRPVTEEARIAGLAWERLPQPKPQLTLEIYFPSGQEHVFYLGPHAPHLTPKEVDLLHSIWLELSSDVAPEEIRAAAQFKVRLQSKMAKSGGPLRS